MTFERLPFGAGVVLQPPLVCKAAVLSRLFEVVCNRQRLPIYKMVVERLSSAACSMCVCNRQGLQILNRQRLPIYKKRYG